MSNKKKKIINIIIGKNELLKTRMSKKAIELISRGGPMTPKKGKGVPYRRKPKHPNKEVT